MDCPRCGAANEARTGICSACGTLLLADDGATLMQKPATTPRPPAVRLAGTGAAPKQCPSCSTLNAATFKFCARCGTPLGATAPLQAGATPAPRTSPPLRRGPTSTPSPPTRPPPPARPPAGPPPVRAGNRPRARISAIARDGTRSADFVLTRDETRIGSQVPDGEVRLDKDPFIAPQHATLRFQGAQLVVEDAGTPNGVFLCVRERELRPGDELRLGKQRLRIEWLPEEPEAVADEPLWGSPDPGYAARAVQLLEGGGDGDVFPLRRGENLIGRGAGDVSFPQDGYVSSRHAILAVGEAQLAVRDLGSANGTWHRIFAPTPLQAGDLMLIGEQILRVDPV